MPVVKAKNVINPEGIELLFVIIIDKMRKILHIKLLIIFIIFFPLILSAQKKDIVTTEGTAQIELLKTKSQLDTEKEAEELATINALERAFGKVIIMGNSTYIKNLNTGKQTETMSVFNMLANTMVKGEVIEVINKKFTDIPGIKTIDGKKINITEVKCDIKIKAKELSEPPIDIISFPLACKNIRCETTSFYDNDILYLYFKSPSSGYLSVFLDDNKNSFRLLPYQNMPVKYEDGMPISADKEYILFSTDHEHNYIDDKDFIEDTYLLDAESAQDMNRLFIIFSKRPLNKPELKDNTKFEKSQGYTLPKALKSEDFQNWLQKNRIFRKDIQVKMIDITISKK